MHFQINYSCRLSLNYIIWCNEYCMSIDLYSGHYSSWFGLWLWGVLTLKSSPKVAFKIHGPLIEGACSNCHLSPHLETLPPTWIQPTTSTIKWGFGSKWVLISWPDRWSRSRSVTRCIGVKCNVFLHFFPFPGSHFLSGYKQKLFLWRFPLFISRMGMCLPCLQGSSVDDDQPTPVGDFFQIYI